jgi:RNA-directed DNA polymerase
LMDKTTTTESGEREKGDDVRHDRIAVLSPGLARLRQKLGEKAKSEPKFRFYSLYGHISHIETLRTAWRLIRENGKTPGIDGLTYDDIEYVDDEDKDKWLFADPEAEKVEAYLKGVQEELKSRTYRPMPVRRVYIPKPDGRKRPLGLPVIKDRLVQKALLLIIEPIFEEDFLDCSYGFRPGRSAHEAIGEISKNLGAGRKSVYDADLKGYFDSIPHDQLMKCVEMRITDRTVLKLIEAWLKAPIIEKEKDGNGKWQIKVEKPTKGTPQGGVISPLLANLYLHWFDKRFHHEDGPRQFANARLVRYADDFVVMARYVGGRIKSSIKGLIKDWLKLEINEEKTRTVTLEMVGDSVDFLGYTFRVERSPYEKDRTYIRIEPKKKSIEKAKDKIRELTARNRSHLTIEDFIGKINQFLNGWRAYFKLGHPSRVFRDMDAYVEQRVVNHLRRRSQRGYKKPKGLTWYKYLRKNGLIRLNDKKLRTARA